MAWKCVVTNAGAALLATYAEGGHALNVTSASVAAGIMDEINMRVATALTDEKDAASIINRRTVENGTKFKVQVGPAEDAVGAYTAHQIGLWANLDSGARTLLALAQDSTGGVGVPLKSTTPSFAFALYITIAVSNTGEITVVVDGGAFVTVSTLEEAIEDAMEGVLDDVYTKAQADELLEDKADAEDTYTKDEVDRAIGTRAERHIFDVTVPATGWTQAGGLYSVSVNVPGMLATDSCGGAGPVQTGTEATDKEMRRAWGRVTRITAGAGSITVYASRVPEVAIPLQIEVFR